MVRLGEESRRHPATTHAWLGRLLHGDSNDVRDALRAIAHTHVGFIGWIPAMLQTVSARCTDARDRHSLEHARDIERGDDVTSSRRALFRRFCSDVGLTQHDLRHLPVGAAHWRSAVQQRLEIASVEFGIGVLGPGYADVASAIYSRVILGCQRFPEFAHVDLTFFRAHVPDGIDPHQRQIAAVSRRIAESPSRRDELRRGMLFGLDARAAVWDSLTRR